MACWPSKTCTIQKHMKEATRVITLHITLHQSNIFPDLELLLSGFAIAFKVSTRLPENRNRTANLKSVGPNQGLDYLFTTQYKSAN